MRVDPECAHVSREAVRDRLERAAAKIARAERQLAK
jgi:hypothetical protein